MKMTALPLTDRRAAGRALAERLQPHAADDPLVLALPRGGVPVAYEIAVALKAELDVALVRKIGAPGNPELALGAVIDTEPPLWVANEALIARLATPDAWFDEQLDEQLAELRRRRRVYCAERPAPSPEGRTVILVDDGIATGATVRAVLLGLAESAAQRVILAVPVAPREVAEQLRGEVDELVCLATPEPFGGVGQHYLDFDQLEDSEVCALLAAARQITDG